MEPEMEIFPIHQFKDVMNARKKGREMADRLGFGRVDQTIIAYTISELAAWLIGRHERGQLVIRCVRNGSDVSGIELRLFERSRHRIRIDHEWVRILVDDMEVKNERSRGNWITLRKWRSASFQSDGQAVHKPVLAAGEE